MHKASVQYYLIVRASVELVPFERHQADLSRLRSFRKTLADADAEPGTRRRSCFPCPQINSTVIATDRSNFVS